jgi:hypothetical protein
MWCPKCGAEYRPGFTACADCRLPLVDQPPNLVDESNDAAVGRPGHTPDPHRRFVELVRVSALEAPMIVNRLRSEGAASANLGAEPIYRSFAFTEGVPILIADDERDLANEILASLDEEP